LVEAVSAPAETERLRRWRLALGGDEADGIGCGLSETDLTIDRALSALYEEKDNLKVGRGKSSPTVARWLGDIRTYFPSSVVRVMQKDAMERLDLKRLLLEPEMLEAVQPDVHLVATLLSLGSVMPTKAKDTARQVVRKVVDDLMKKLAEPMRQAVRGALRRSIRNRRPRHSEIDWHRTIRANLKHYQKKYKTVVPETRIGYGRRRAALREVVLCLDQSGSMATSVVYAGVFGAALASLPSLKTHVIAYDTEVADLTDKAGDPVDILFGTQLGGGNDTPRALAYCRGLIRRPTDTVFVLISDLYEGELSKDMLKRLSGFVAAGVQCIVLLALADDGAPSYEHENAAALAAMGVPVFACTPDAFPDLMAAALSRQDIGQWAAARGITAARKAGT
jgi:hypothetical protein